MGSEVAFAVIAIALILLLLTGHWIAFSLSSIALASFMILLEGKEGMMALLVFNKIGSFHFFAMPLFLLMGEILLVSKVGSDIIEGLSPMFNRFRGGLLYTTIFGNALFAAICGSSLAALGALGPMLVSELSKKGYEKKIAFGTLSTAGTLAVMIPPSMGMIFYGMVADQSIGTLFIAILIPGLILTGLLALTTFIWVRVDPKLVPKTEQATWGEALKSMLSLWPIIALIIVVLGSIYGGICTATEAGAIGVFGAFLIAVLKNRVGVKGLFSAVYNSVTFTGVIGMLVAGAVSFSYVFSNAGLTTLLTSWLEKLPGPPGIKMLQLLGIYFVLGLFIDPPCMTLITVPLFLPFVVKQGYDPIWFGVFQTICTEIGVITPPVGANLYILQALTGEDLITIVRGTMPYWVTCAVLVILIIYFPQLATWLPSKM